MLAHQVAFLQHYLCSESVARSEAREMSTAALGVVYTFVQVTKIGQRSPHLGLTNQAAEQVLDGAPCKKLCGALMFESAGASSKGCQD